MFAFSLQSGSCGNSIYVEADGVRLLVDAGISGRQAKLRMAEYGCRMQDVDALLVTHEHSDHVCSAGTWNRLFGFPIFMTEPTFQRCRTKLGKVRDLRFFRAGTVVEIGSVRVHSIGTKHDAVDGVAFIIEASGRRLGVFTDLGHAFADLHFAMDEVDAVFIESNYDPHMLEVGPYPEKMKARIRGKRGHLSNDEAAWLLATRGRNLQWACLAHLSANNNTPEIALRTHRAALGDEYPLHIAPRYKPGPRLEVC